MMMALSVTYVLLVTSVHSSGHFKQLNPSFEYLTRKALYSTSRCFFIVVMPFSCGKQLVPLAHKAKTF
jgi:hypothetical protein